MDYMYIFGFMILAYFIAKTLNISNEIENERLKKCLIKVEHEKKCEKEKHLERIGMLSDALENYERTEKRNSISKVSRRRRDY